MVKGILYENDNPHITICCKKGVKPVESNDLLSPKKVQRYQPLLTWLCQLWWNVNIL
eukprot:gnl/Chilomastix_caulleri/7773.p1 GENE.gnl/Chilomastix_caulleri/7773~~gnl/Chilomastix_caulleri/7773.p1  ORF type:complete len:57 (+),score=8.58 gnl/Chilomastix_caulleri/7773:159-329(+)